MASLMTMNFTEFVTDFLHQYDYTKYEIIIISKELCASRDDKTNKDKSKYANVDFASDLYPLPMCLSYKYESRDDQFKEAYLNQLDGMFEDVSLNIWSIADMIVRDDRNIVLICSDSEEKLKYLDILLEYIDVNYKIPGITYEHFKKYGEYKEEINIEESLKMLEFRKGLMEENAEVIVFNKFTETLFGKFKEILSTKSMEELREYCKLKGIFVKRTSDKELMVDYILDKLQRTMK